MEGEFIEMDEGTHYIGYEEAFSLVCSNLQPVGVEDIPLDSCVGRILSEDLVALISYPSIDVSLKDGFAVRSEEVSAASIHRPVCLRVIGSVFAGSGFDGEVKRGNAVKICSGAPIPQGLNAVVSGEFCREASADEVWVCADAEPGRNVLRSGGEITAGSTIARRGEVPRPGCLGLAAAAGISRVRAYRRPRAALIGVGDEVISPGPHLLPNQLYASNLFTIGAWLTSFGVPYVWSVIKDNEKAIKTDLLEHLPSVDTILTSGGAWGSERDLVIGTLHGLGWREIFHNVRMGPGKGIDLGLLEGKPYFACPVPRPAMRWLSCRSPYQGYCVWVEEIDILSRLFPPDLQRMWEVATGLGANLKMRRSPVISREVIRSPFIETGVVYRRLRMPTVLSAFQKAPNP
jgi:molybdopterin molybdotransferase